MRQVPIPLFGLAFLLAGCGPTIVADFDSPEPAARNSAIVQAAASKDEGAVPDLVRMLDSDDPATRLLAIGTLERITGETLGFDYAGPESEREEAIQRWTLRLDDDQKGRRLAPGEDSPVSHE